MSGMAAVDDAMATAMATVTSVLAGDPDQALATLADTPPELRMLVTLALASMVASSMESIADLERDGGAEVTVEEIWQSTIVEVLAARPDW